MKTTTMLWLGAAAVAGYYLYKRGGAATNTGAQAVTTAPTVNGQPMSFAVPDVVVVDDVYDYPVGWTWSGPSWSWGGPRRGRGGHGGGHHHHHHHGGGGGHRGRR